MKNKKIEVLVLLLILLSAAFLRLYRIADYMTFLGDEGRDVLVVKRIIVDHKLTLLGPTASVGGFFLGPLYYYMILPFLWAFRLDPVGPAVMVALFGGVTVWLVYKVGKEFFDLPTGLLAAGLYTISPLVIAYSRSSWNPNLMPFFSLLIIYVTWLAITKNRLKLFWLVGLLFGIAFQLHYLAVFLLIAVGIYLLFFLPLLKNLKNYLKVFAGFLIGWSPFILFELRHGFPNLRTLYRFVLFGEETGFVAHKFLPTVSDVSFRLFSRLLTNNQKQLALLLFFLSIGFFVYSWLKEKKKIKTYSLLGIWLIVGVFLFGFYQKGIYDYYFGFMFPLPFLLTGLAITRLGKINKISLAGVWVIVFLLVFVNLKGIPFRYPPNRQLEQTRQIARLILEKSEGKSFNFALITGQNSDHAYRYFLEIGGARPVTIENPQVDPERKTVTDQLLVVCELADCQPLGHPLWEIAGFGRAEIVEQWDVSVHKIYKLKHWRGEDK